MVASPCLYRTVKELPAWGTAKNPPKEFLLFPFGASSATFDDGSASTVYLTKEGAAGIVSEWARRNIRGMFDFNHDFGLSWGWYDIEVRADGLWLVDIEWTADTLAHFRLKKIRYCSPAFRTDNKNNITRLTNVALTNLPATDNQRPLIALSLIRGKRRRYSMLTPDQAIEKANAIIAACEGKPELADKVALLLMGGDEPVAEPALEGGAEMANPAQEEEQMIAASAIALTGLKGRACVGALKQFSTVLVERDAARKELAAIKHNAAVERAIAEKRLPPSKRAEALAADPVEFLGAMRFASIVIDTETLSAKTNEPKIVKAEDAINDDMKTYCKKTGQDITKVAQRWVAKFPGTPFTL
jgi:hypothetical protein